MAAYKKLGGADYGATGGDGTPNVGSYQSIYQPGDFNAGLPEPAGYKNLPFLLAFVLHLLGVIVLLIVGAAKAPSSTGVMMASWFSGTNQSSVDLQATGGPDTVIPVALLAISVIVAMGAGIVVSVLWLLVAKTFPRQLIVATIIGNCLTWFGAAGYTAYLANKSGQSGQYVFAAGLALVGLLSCLFYFLWRKRIPFAAALLATVSHVVGQYPGVILFAFIGLLMLFAWMTLWGFATSLTFGWTQNQDSQGLTYALSVYLLFSFYWTSQVIKNIFFCTTSGLFATWYFASASMPANPTIGSFKRATTTSLGSICLGSLLVALLQTLRSLVRSMRNKRNAILICLIDCILSLFERLLRYFNKYAYVYVACYGFSYCEAAHHTFDLIKSRGIDAIVNDSILGAVFGLGCMLGAILSGMVGAAYGAAAMPGGYFWVLTAFISFISGFVCLSQIVAIMDAGVTTIFVAFAMDPAALARQQPELHQLFSETYNLT